MQKYDLLLHILVDKNLDEFNTFIKLKKQKGRPLITFSSWCGNMPLAG